MIKAVLFDLDDTLYLEADYYRSGFAAAARELFSRGVGPVDSVLALLESIHDLEGKEHVFDKAVARLGLPGEWVHDLVAIVRAHQPSIKLTAETIEALTVLQNRYALGCVTDGFARTQRHKLDALEIGRFVSKTILSDDLGREYWKPHPRGLIECAEHLNVTPNQCVYVGDSLERDIRAAHSAGMLGVRICLPGGYSSSETDDGTDTPEAEVSSLSDLPQAIGGLDARRTAGVLSD